MQRQPFVALLEKQQKECGNWHLDILLHILEHSSLELRSGKKKYKAPDIILYPVFLPHFLSQKKGFLNFSMIAILEPKEVTPHCRGRLFVFCDLYLQFIGSHQSLEQMY